jgi:mannose-6-phosphate isomerase-like protein (cupin superfamily)
MTMKITEIAKVASSKNPHNVDLRKIFDSPSTAVVIITLKPGESLKKHVTPVDVLFYVLEGTGVVEIGEERQSVGKDSLVESPAMIAHTLHNESNAVFRFMLIKMMTTGKGKAAQSQLL